MKLVLTLSFIVAVVVSVGNGSLIIFEIFSVDRGLEYLLKALAVIILLGAASAPISPVTGNKNIPSEQP